MTEAIEYEQFEQVDAPIPRRRRSEVDLSRLSDIPMELSVEIGRTHMTVGETLDLRVGSVVTLERLAGETADLLVNGSAIARGEVVVIDEQYGLRITEILDGSPTPSVPEGEQPAVPPRRAPSEDAAEPRRGGRHADRRGGLTAVSRQSEAAEAQASRHSRAGSSAHRARAERTRARLLPADEVHHRAQAPDRPCARPLLRGAPQRLAGELKAEVELSLTDISQHTWAAAKAQLPADSIAVAVHARGDRAPDADERRAARSSCRRSNACSAARPHRRPPSAI